MSIDFLSLIQPLLNLLQPIKVNLEAKLHRTSSLFTLERRNFPDCDNKEFTYGKRPWNPFGKTGLAHHGPNGWDFFLPEEIKK